MLVTANDIAAYIDFLSESQNLYISLHGSISNISVLARYNFHLHPCCIYVKTACQCWETCIQRQHKIMEHLKNGDFFGVCYAGIGEFVYPLKENGKIFGFISVSGYKGDKDLTSAKQLRFSEKFGIDCKKLQNQCKKNLKTPPKKEYIDTVIRPLILLCETLYSKLVMPDKSEELYSSIIRYINVNHTSHITMEILSKKFNYSVSTLSHLFFKKSGMSLTKYIENLRIDEAKWMLTQFNISVTEISAVLGFCNSGHFSTTFKKSTGISPKQYRILMQNQS